MTKRQRLGLLLVIIAIPAMNVSTNIIVILLQAVLAIVGVFLALGDK